MAGVEHCQAGWPVWGTNTGLRPMRIGPFMNIDHCPLGLGAEIRTAKAEEVRPDPSWNTPASNKTKPILTEETARRSTRFTGQRYFRFRRSGREAVALLVLLARAARAGRVARDLVPDRLGGPRGRARLVVAMADLDPLGPGA